MFFPIIVSPSFPYFILLILLSPLTRFLLIWFFHPKYFFPSYYLSSFYHPFPFSLMHSSRNLSPPLPLPLPFIPTRESTGELLTAAGGRGEGWGGKWKQKLSTISLPLFLLPLPWQKKNQKKGEDKWGARVSRKNKHPRKIKPTASPVFFEDTGNWNVNYSIFFPHRSAHNPVGFCLFIRVLINLLVPLKLQLGACSCNASVPVYVCLFTQCHSIILPVRLCICTPTRSKVPVFVCLY